MAHPVRRWTVALRAVRLEADQIDRLLPHPYTVTTIRSVDRTALEGSER